MLADGRIYGRRYNDNVDINSSKVLSAVPFLSW